ncbi:MAG: SPOR domain-containing protein [Gammaproteobacteria bacterium]|nr:SPOR domain-containing protein [Gammaproteobacteria bacterium]
MDETIKKRLVGAIVLVALAIIFVPFLLEEKETLPQSAVELEETIPVQSTQKFRSGLVPDEKTATQDAIRASSQEDDFNISEGLDLSEYKPSAVTGNNSGSGGKADEGQRKADKKPEKVSGQTAASKHEKESVAAATAKKQAVPKSGWVIQVGAFGRKSNADNLSKKLTNGGMKAYIEESSKQNKKLYHVRVGPYSNKSKAQQDRSKAGKVSGLNVKVLNLK